MNVAFERWARPTEQDLAGYALLMSQIFGTTLPQAACWLGRVGAGRARVVLEDRDVVAGLAAYDMGIVFGGRAVPCAGIAGVAVRSDQRRQGVASAMMRRALQDAHRAGEPLSALYAANHNLYRSVGYEIAGSHTLVGIAPDRIGVSERGGKVRPLREEDEAIRQALYQRVVLERPGHLIRHAGLWRRATHDRDDHPLSSWLVMDEGGLPVGYVTLQRRGGDGIEQVLRAVDLIALTPWALRRLLSFLADLGSVVGELLIPTGPGDPLVLALDEPRLRVDHLERWLLRVVNLAPALEARGWPVAAAGQVDLEVEDDLLPGNAGRWRLEVADGSARVTRGGSGAIRLDPRGLATLYSGYTPPWAALRAGLIEGPEEQIAILSSLLAGPAPWMMERF